MYRPEAVIAELDDAARVPALCFNLPVPPRLDELNKVYTQRRRDLARRVGLPASYVERIEWRGCSVQPEGSATWADR